MCKLYKTNQSKYVHTRVRTYVCTIHLTHSKSSLPSNPLYVYGYENLISIFNSMQTQTMHPWHSLTLSPLELVIRQDSNRPSLSQTAKWVDIVCMYKRTKLACTKISVHMPYTCTHVHTYIHTVQVHDMCSVCEIYGV